MSTDRVIDEALLSETTIPKEKLVWVESAKSIRTLSKLFRLTRDRYYEITADLGGDLTCRWILRYLLRCIEENVADDDEDLADKDKIEGRWEAAESLALLVVTC